MTQWLNGAMLAVSIMGALMGALLLVLARRRSWGATFLGAGVFLYAVGFVEASLFLLGTLGGVSAAALLLFNAVLSFLTYGAISAFGIVYPRRVLERRHKIGLLLVALFTGVFIAGVLLSPSTFVSHEFFTRTGWDVVSIGYSGANLVAVTILGYRWLGSEPGPRRNQIAWGLIPFMFFAIHDGLGFGVLPLVFGPRYALGELFPGLLAAMWGVFLVTGLLAVLVLAGIAIARVLQGDPTSDERALGFVTLYTLPVAFVQVLDPGFGIVGGMKAHLLVDGLFYVLVAYGVLRYNVVDVDLKLKWSLKQGSVGAVFVAVFFVASELAALFFEGVAGSAVLGILAAGGLLLVISPLQRFAERVSNRAMPHVEDTRAYREKRKRTIYRAQAETLISDGHVSAKERRALLRLQDDLALDPGVANRVEADVLERIQGGTDVGSEPGAVG